MKQSTRPRVHVQTKAPSIDFQFETRDDAVPPSFIQTGRWNGKLYLGSISAAVSEDWLRWARVTHVVCVLGEFADKNVVAHEWMVAHKNRFSDISYLDWPISVKFGAKISI